MRLDILTRDRIGNTLENYLAPRLQQAFECLGLDTRVITLDQGVLGEYMTRACPDFTLATQELIANQTPLCDILKIPHLQWEWDCLADSAHMLESEYGNLAYGEILDDVLFLPPAVDSDLKGEETRPFDVVLFAPYADMARKRATWQTLFGEEGRFLLEHAVSLEMHPLAAACKLRAPSVGLQDILCGVEEMRWAHMIHDLVMGCEEVELHLFGEHVGGDLLKRIPGSVRLHQLLPYPAQIEVLKSSKILLSPHLEYTNGSDRWLLAALQVGALPLMTPNAYLRELLGDETLFFTSQEELLEKIHLYLADSEKRERVMRFYADKLIPQHTWETRAKDILSWMEQKI